METIEIIEKLLRKYSKIHEQLELEDVDGIIPCELHHYNCVNRDMHKLRTDPTNILNLKYEFHDASLSIFKSLRERDQHDPDVLIWFVVFFLLPEVIFESFNNHMSTEQAVRKVLTNLVVD